MENSDKENNLEEENWVDIKNYKNRYQISDQTRVKSLLSGKILKPIMRGGYYAVKLHAADQTRKTYHVHILVAKHFVKNDNPEVNIIVHHIDHNKLNNKPSNLQWVTNAKNSKEYHKQKKDKSGKIKQFDLDGKFIKEWDSINDMIKENTTYDRKTIGETIRGRRKTAYGYKWEFSEPKEKIKIIIEKDEIFKNAGILLNKDLSLYNVSTYGKIKNAETGKFLKPAIGSNGYYQVSLHVKGTKDNVNFKVHRLVALVFMPDKHSETVNYVNHINENKLDNRLTNLEWVTNRENTIHSTGRKVNQIDAQTGKIIKTFNSLSLAADEVKKTDAMGIIRCCKNKGKLSSGFKWAYAD